MPQTCETVAVKADNDDGYKIINKSDLTDDDVLVGESAEKQKAEQKAKPKKKAKAKAE